MNPIDGASLSDPLRYELRDYFPEAYYKNATDQAFREETEEELRSDGDGRTLSYWSGLLGFLADR